VSDTAAPESLPLDKLVALLPDSDEFDARWGARRAGERIPFTKQIAIRRVEHEKGQTTEVELEVQVERDESKGPLEGWALNVCHGGMRIISETPLKVGETIAVEVQSGGRSYSGTAKVCWVREQADGVIAGLEFHR